MAQILGIITALVVVACGLATMQINRQFGDYFLLERLAVGGQSEVFLARRRGPYRFQRPVVIKALPEKYAGDPKFVELFYQEAFIAARFSHPNLIAIHDAKEVEGEHVMVMDYVAGQTVSDIAQRGAQIGRPLSLLQSVQIIIDACAGLHYGHGFSDVDDEEYQIVHCDVSPQNLMVNYKGVTKVFDFGISRILGRPIGPEGVGGGKYAYMSPEQCKGEDVDPRSDIFSLGIILYELATGYRLFRRDTKPDVIRALTEEPIEPPSLVNPEVPMYLERCILKALERDRNVRYQSAAQFGEDLDDFLKMHRSATVREELGEYVGRLFEAEREQIVEILRRDDDELESSQPTPDLEQPSDDEALKAAEEARAVLAAVREREAIVKRRYEALKARFKQVERRQSFLLAALFVIAFLALGMGFYTFQLSLESIGEVEAVELSSESH